MNFDKCVKKWSPVCINLFEQQTDIKDIDTYINKVSLFCENQQQYILYSTDELNDYRTYNLDSNMLLPILLKSIIKYILPLNINYNGDIELHTIFNFKYNVEISDMENISIITEILSEYFINLNLSKYENINILGFKLLDNGNDDYVIIGKFKYY